MNLHPLKQRRPSRRTLDELKEEIKQLNYSERNSLKAGSLNRIYRLVRPCSSIIPQ